MADWTHKPFVGYRIEKIGPRVLTHRYEDGVAVRVEKSSTVKRRFIARFRFKVADAKDPLDDLEGWGLDTAFDIITYSPQAADPDTDEATVYQVELPEPEYVAPNVVEWESTFEEA